MKRRFSKGRTVGIFLVVLAIEILLLMSHLELLPWRGKAKSSEGLWAGQVLKSRNQLRRRDMNSLVWEKSQQDDAVHFYDSVLTLKESTASISLLNKTEVELSENTLITIEPPDARKAGEIRLKFVRGNLQSRNPYAAATVQADAWTVNVQTGSEVELFSSGDGTFDLQVKKGEVKVESPLGSSQASSNQLLRLNSAGALKVDLDSANLRWRDLPPRRLYTHSSHLPVPLRWTGLAREVTVSTLGSGDKTIPVAAAAQETILELPLGHHRIFLRDGEKQTPPFSLEVWRSPSIHLLSPLPRNRVQVNTELDFLWVRSPLAPSYRFEASGEMSALRESVRTNRFTHTFSEVENLRWTVFGIDEEGFEIPPSYDYPLFLRDDPFAPPTIHSPKIREPASDDRGASYLENIWFWFVPRAMAETDKMANDLEFEATFNWGLVSGADQYVIEISQTEDFRKPLIVKTLKNPRYVWKGFQRQTYYWRVAAGHSNGRMGIFSEPAQINFAKLDQNSPAVIDGVRIRQIVNAPVAASLKGPAVGVPKKLRPLPPEGAGDRELIAHGIKPVLFWQPRFSHMNLQGDEESKASLSGLGSLSFLAEGGFIDSADTTWRLQFAGASQAFTPKNKDDFPFQKDLTWHQYSFSLARFAATENWGWGVRALSSVYLKRQDFEEVVMRDELGGGPMLLGDWQRLQWRYLFESALIFTGSGQGLVMRTEARYRSLAPFVIGGGGEVSYIFRPSGQSLLAHVFLSMGFEF